MSQEIKAPVFPESVAEGTVASWHKQPGEQVNRDEVLADIETDKVVLEVVAPEDGILEKIEKQQGDIVSSGEVIGHFAIGSKTAKNSKTEKKEADAPENEDQVIAASKNTTGSKESQKAGPAARKMMKEAGVDHSQVVASGKGGTITKKDVENHIQQGSSSPNTDLPVSNIHSDYERFEKRVPMTRLRASIANRLVQAQHEAAMLTTFNEVNMQPIITLRKTYKESFEKTHKGVRLGFMGFFIRAAAEALKRFPAVNASIDGNDIVYHGYQDIGVAVSSERGLIVPVIRHVEHLTIANIEAAISDFSERARDNKIHIDELQGGTFTITNGGIFGSLMSTPILNPPQTGILGMHSIKERPIVENGEIVIRPMMYLALSYDHRVIDGKEAVQFLVAIKNMLEDPARIILEL